MHVDVRHPAEQTGEQAGLADGSCMKIEAEAARTTAGGDETQTAERPPALWLSLLFIRGLAPLQQLLHYHCQRQEHAGCDLLCLWVLAGCAEFVGVCCAVWCRAVLCCVQVPAWRAFFSGVGEVQQWVPAVKEQVSAGQPAGGRGQQLQGSLLAWGASGCMYGWVGG